MAKKIKVTLDLRYKTLQIIKQQINWSYNLIESDDYVPYILISNEGKYKV